MWQLDQDRIPQIPLRDHPGRPRPAERIEYFPTSRASGEDAGLDQIGREGREVSAFEGRRGHGPNRAFIAHGRIVIV